MTGCQLGVPFDLSDNLTQSVAQIYWHRFVLLQTNNYDDANDAKTNI